MYPILLNEQATLLVYVGKTEEAFAILLIDLDGQANLTLYFIPNENEIDAHVHIGHQVELSVDTITAYITQVISLL